MTATPTGTPTTSAPTALPRAAARPTRITAPLIALIPAAAVIAGHGAIHLMGTAALWQIGEPGELRPADMVPAVTSWTAAPAGGVWLLAAVLFVAAAVALVARTPAWWWLAFGGVLVSLPVVVSNAEQAAGGVFADGLLLAVLLATRIAPRLGQRP